MTHKLLAALEGVRQLIEDNKRYKKALEQIFEGLYGEASGPEHPNAWKIAAKALKHGS